MEVLDKGRSWSEKKRSGRGFPSAPACRNDYFDKLYPSAHTGADEVPFLRKARFSLKNYKTISLDYLCVSTKNRLSIAFFRFLYKGAEIVDRGDFPW